MMGFISGLMLFACVGFWPFPVCVCVCVCVCAYGSQAEVSLLFTESLSLQGGEEGRGERRLNALMATPVSRVGVKVLS